MSHEIAKRIRDAPPRCIGGFVASYADEDKKESDHFYWVAFDLKCHKCGQSAFELTALSVQWGEPPHTNEIGVESVCSGCGSRVRIFDSVIDGYDGELGHMKTMDGNRYATPLEGYESSPVEVRVTFLFNATITDLDETAKDTGKRAQDLFDAFNLEMRTLGTTEWRDTWVCECA